MNRLLLIGSGVIGLHFLILTLPILPQKIIKPTLNPIKRIAVSFIAKHTTPKKIKEETSAHLPEKPQEKEIIEPKPQPEKIVPPPKPQITPSKKQVKKISKSRETTKVIPADSTPNKIAPTITKEITEAKTDNTKQQPEDEQFSKPSANVVQKATPLYKVNPPPAYPRLARRRGFEGTVFIDVFINTSGEVTKLKLAKSSGHTILDKAAIKSIRIWKFTPGSQSGKPAEMWVTVPVHFKLTHQ
jgi:protein TonB